MHAGSAAPTYVSAPATSNGGTDPTRLCWALVGNAGTTPGTGAGQNYLGTQDNVDMVWARAATEYARLNSTGVLLSRPLTVNNPAGANTTAATFQTNGSTRVTVGKDGACTFIAFDLAPQLDGHIRLPALGNGISGVDGLGNAFGYVSGTNVGGTKTFVGSLNNTSQAVTIDNTASANWWVHVAGAFAITINSGEITMWLRTKVQGDFECQKAQQESNAETWTPVAGDTVTLSGDKRTYYITPAAPVVGNVTLTLPPAQKGRLATIVMGANTISNLILAAAGGVTFPFYTPGPTTPGQVISLKFREAGQQGATASEWWPN